LGLQNLSKLGLGPNQGTQLGSLAEPNLIFLVWALANNLSLTYNLGAILIQEPKFLG